MTLRRSLAHQSEGSLNVSDARPPLQCMGMLCLVCALVLDFDQVKDGRVTVWSPSLTIQELAGRLSEEGQRFSADAAVANRRAAVFAKDRPTAEIASMAADCLGMRLRKVGSGWMFVADPDHDAVVRGHAEDIRTQTREALRQLILDFRENPPTPATKRRPNDSAWTTRLPGDTPMLKIPADLAKRRQEQVERWRYHTRSWSTPEMPWLFAKANDRQVEQLLAGHCVMASVPARDDGTISLPGKPSDYEMLRGLEHVYVVAQFKPDEGRFQMRYYSRGVDLRGRASDGTMVLHVGNTVRGEPDSWTALDARVQKWRGPLAHLDTASFPTRASFQQTFGGWLEEAARKSSRPVVAIASPRRYDGDLSSLSAVREDGSWLQVWPPLFWLSESDFAHLAKPVPDPDIADPIAALDTVLAYGAADVEDLTRLVREGPRPAQIQANRHGHEFRYGRDLWRLWHALSETEKRTALTSGLARTRLKPEVQLLFDDALFTSTIYDIPKGEVIDLVAPAARQKVVLRISQNRKGLLAAESGSGTFDYSRADDAIRLNRNDVPFNMLELDFIFESGAASASRDFQILRTYRPGGTGG